MAAKRALACLIIASLALSLLAGCAGGPEKEKEYIGIISAMDNEIDVLLKEAQIERVDTIAGVEYHVGTLRGQPVIITRAGIGKVRASSGVTWQLSL